MRPLAWEPPYATGVALKGKGGGAGGAQAEKVAFLNSTIKDLALDSPAVLGKHLRSGTI